MAWLAQGSGVPAKVTFDLIKSNGSDGKLDIRNLVLTGDAFGAKGNLSIAGGDFQSADFSDIRLTRSDRLSVKATKARVVIALPYADLNLTPVRSSNRYRTFRKEWRLW